MGFREKLEARIEAVNSLLCIGLDPHEKELTNVTPDGAFTFCKTLILQTLPYAACYKPNIAFFEVLGDGGIQVLQRLVKEVIPDDVPVLLDCKRGDIGSTAAAYADASYQYLGADAVTLSPLMGWDSVAPFVTEKYSDKGAFLLCKTSNPGSRDVLGLALASNKTLYEHLATMIGHQWVAKAPSALMGLVVGATDPVAMEKARQAGGDAVWILSPGVGAQGGDLKATLQAGLNSKGTGLLIPVSRGISRAEQPGVAAKELQERIQAVRQEIMGQTPPEADDSSSILPYQKEFLEFSLDQGVLKFGSFVLKSGRTSPYFFNAGLFASGAALFKLGKAYASTIMNSPVLVDSSTGNAKFEVLFGPAYKGISLGAVVASALYSDYGVDVGFSYNRKEAKDHGEGGKLVGAGMAHKKVLIIDDVITAGTAIREAHGMLQQVEAEPVGVVIALDRAEVRAVDDRISAVQAVERDLGFHVVSIVNLPQLQTFLNQHPNYDDATRQSVAAYRQEFGV